jgi:predicted O-methyltransferase YrrM
MLELITGLEKTAQSLETRLGREGRGTRATTLQALDKLSIKLSREVDVRSKQIRTQVVEERRKVLSGLASSEARVGETVAASGRDVEEALQISVQKLTSLHDGLREVVDDLESQFGEEVARSDQATAALERLLQAVEAMSAVVATSTALDVLQQSVDAQSDRAGRSLDDLGQRQEQMAAVMVTGTALDVFQQSVDAQSDREGKSLDDLRSRQDQVSAALTELAAAVEDVKEQARVAIVAAESARSHDATRSEDVVARLRTSYVEGVGTLQGSFDEGLADLRAAYSESVSGVQQSLSTEITRIEQSVADSTSRLTERQAKESNKLVVAMRSETQEVEALLQLFSGFEPRWAMPSLGRWALDARAALHLRYLVEDRKPRRIVEFGGGSSTVWLGYLCERLGVELISIDHEETFLERTRAMLEHHQLSDAVETRLGRLEEYTLDGRKFSWYASESFKDVEAVDLLFVDGPPSTTGPMARYPAFPLLRTRLSSPALVILDDAERPDETSAIEQWQEQEPGLIRIQEGVSRLAVFDLSPAAD